MTDTADNDPDIAGRAAERSEPALPPSTSVDPAAAEPSPTGPATIETPSEETAATAPAPSAEPSAALYRPGSAPTYPTASVPEAPAAYAPASVPQRRRPRLATILWGVLLLAFAAFMLIAILVPGTDATRWLLGVVVAIGLLLVVVGIAAAARRAG